MIYYCTVRVTNNFTHAWHSLRGTTQLFAWDWPLPHRGARNCHAWKKRFPCHDIATCGVLVIATRVVLAIDTCGVLEIATHEIISMQGYCVIQYHAWLKGWTRLNSAELQYIYCMLLYLVTQSLQTFHTLLCTLVPWFQYNVSHTFHYVSPSSCVSLNPVVSVDSISSHSLGLGLPDYPV